MSAVRGSCLCGTVRWEAQPPLQMMSHCHCSRCRKAHGAAYATFVLVPAAAFRTTAGDDAIVRFRASEAGLARPFCGRCGSVVPDAEPWNGLIGMPAGPLDDDPVARPLAHIFVGSQAPWFEIRDDLPRFAAYPPGFDAPPVPDRPPRDPAGQGVRGSCLCDGVGWVVTGAPLRAVACHCSRCRKARAAAFATNLFTRAEGVRFTRGEELVASYKVPEARHFMHVFCRTCGSGLPRIDPARDLAVVPMGALDDDPKIAPQYHIFVGSKAPWDTIADDLPRHAGYPPQA